MYGVQETNPITPDFRQNMAEATETVRWEGY